MALLLGIGLVMCVLAAAAIGVTAVGSKRWAERMTALTREIEAARNEGTFRPPYPMRYDAHELDGLPAPVQRYFRAVLKDGQPVVSAITIEMTGTINMSATAEKWKPFTSKQRVATRRPGFMWDAQISMLPGVTVRVVDSYIAGKGLLQAAMQGLFTVADMGGSEMARGEFMRFFAETPWYPTALLPSQGVQWAAVDGTSAKATLVDGSVTLTLLFHFNAAGLIESVRAEARGSLVGKEIVMRPWECGMSNYQVREGMTVPFSGTAAWVLPEGPKAYFHGAVKSLIYEWAPRTTA
jgi:hypothetical protein